MSITNGSLEPDAAPCAPGVFAIEFLLYPYWGNARIASRARDAP